MRAAVWQRLAELNRDFYEAHGEAFAETRPRLAPGAQRVLARIPPGAAVLEVGCGDGKAGRWLAQHTAGVTYLGLDASQTLLARARRYTAHWAAGRPAPAALAFQAADLLDPAWPAGLGTQTFQWGLAFAVLHHLPGAETRAAVVRALAERLAPAGWLALSNWQFAQDARLRRRTAPWDAIGLTAADVEPDDYLLTWERAGRRGLRYVHAISTAEVRALAAQAGLTVAEIFQADGGPGNLAEYGLLRRPPLHQTGRSAADVSLI